MLGVEGRGHQPEAVRDSLMIHTLSFHTPTHSHTLRHLSTSWRAPASSSCSCSMAACSAWGWLAVEKQAAVSPGCTIVTVN